MNIFKMTKGLLATASATYNPSNAAFFLSARTLGVLMHEIVFDIFTCILLEETVSDCDLRKNGKQLNNEIAMDVRNFIKEVKYRK